MNELIMASLFNSWSTDILKIKSCPLSHRSEALIFFVLNVMTFKLPYKK